MSRRAFAARLAALGALAALAGAGCAPSMHGQLALASTRALAVPMEIVARDVEGEVCGAKARLEGAVDAALANAPGANALVNAELRVGLRCITARGTAVRTLPRAPETGG
jgi:hypothetical protein